MIRTFQKEDAAELVRLSAACARGATGFVVNSFWETEDELFAEFDRFDIDPRQHLLVWKTDTGKPGGLVGFVRQPDSPTAGFYSSRSSSSKPTGRAVCGSHTSA